MKFHASYTSTPQLLLPSSMWKRSTRVIVSLEESQIVSFLAIWEGTKLFPHKNFYLKCCLLFWHLSTRVQNHQIRLASFYDAPMQSHKACLTQVRRKQCTWKSCITRRTCLYDERPKRDKQHAWLHFEIWLHKTSKELKKEQGKLSNRWTFKTKTRNFQLYLNIVYCYCMKQWSLLPRSFIVYK